MDWVMRYKEIDSQAKAWAVEERVRIIQEALASGLSQTEIARSLGSNRKAIYRLLKKHRDVGLGITSFAYK